MGVHREHFHRRRAISERTLAASVVAATLVWRYTIRLHLSAGIAVWHCRVGQILSDDGSARLPHLCGVLLLPGYRRSVSAGSYRLRIAWRGVARGRRLRAALAGVFVPAPLADRFLAISRPSQRARALRRRPAHDGLRSAPHCARGLAPRGAEVDAGRYRGRRTLLRARRIQQLLRRRRSCDLFSAAVVERLDRASGQPDLAARAGDSSPGLCADRVLAVAVLPPRHDRQLEAGFTARQFVVDLGGAGGRGGALPVSHSQMGKQETGIALRGFCDWILALFRTAERAWQISTPDSAWWASRAGLCRSWTLR